MDKKSIERFLDYCKKHITGDEKGEAQILFDPESESVTIAVRQNSK